MRITSVAATVALASAAACSGASSAPPGAAPATIARQQAAPSATAAVACTASLREGTVRVVVEHDGNETWARAAADRACAYLPVAEAYFDVPFHEAASGMFRGLPSPWTVRIVGREHVTLGAVPIGAYNNTAGVFGPDRGIFVEYRLAPPGNPAVLLHELTHDWVHGTGAALEVGARHDDVEPAWFIEGICSMAPIETSATGQLALPSGEEVAMRRHWGQWHVPATARDVAIAHDPRRDGGIAIFYGKSFRVQLLIERELGAAAYRELLHAAATRAPRTNDEVLAMLGARKASVDWRALLSGWIFPGPYAVQPGDIPRLFPAPARRDRDAGSSTGASP